MAAIDEEIVREYFEQNGFFVRQVRKYQVTARKKTDDEEIDLLVVNPAWRKGAGKPDFFLFGTELPKVHRAVVSVKAWHTDRFTPNTLKSNPEIFRFVQEEVIKEVERYFPARAARSRATCSRFSCCRGCRRRIRSRARARGCSRRRVWTRSEGC